MGSDDLPAESEGRRACLAGARKATRARAGRADVAQLAERVLGKDEVTSSILVIGSTRFGRFAASLVAGRGGVESGVPSERSESRGHGRPLMATTNVTTGIFTSRAHNAYGEGKI